MSLDSKELSKSLKESYKLLVKPFVHDPNEIEKLVKFDQSLLGPKFDSSIIQDKLIFKNLQA